MEGSKSPAKMEEALAALLKEGLGKEILAIQPAMDHSQSFRQWLRETHSNTSERLKAGVVPYRSGLPVAIGEHLNMLLDAYFRPKKLHFMKDLALKAFIGSSTNRNRGGDSVLNRRDPENTIPQNP
jgi:hypothetical protein